MESVRRWNVCFSVHAPPLLPFSLSHRPCCCFRLGVCFYPAAFSTFWFIFFYFLYLQEERYCFLWTNTSIIYNEKHFNCSIFCHDLLIRGGAFFGIWLHLYFTYIIYSGTNEWSAHLCVHAHTHRSHRQLFTIKIL